jgi:hypothetical protein
MSLPDSIAACAATSRAIGNSGALQAANKEFVNHNN